ncbi:MAG TPA: 16S rRNA (adenine(1518)-N(6)/adenine(1519)-N(6))-dimethyltransferase RsmA [Phycisphaerae bacterium]|nr:16S rRNA (adenine(1518)-N(6)/adenine(1519)-N(6))-dimethyltransferase RsmA [Phycisphaerae bacterium]
MIPEPRKAAFQTKTMLRGMLAMAGLSPRKRHGQHFLIDRNLMTKLLDSAELRPGDCVLEVGAGTGCLTALLAERAGRVITAEIDEGLAGLARECLAPFRNVTLLRCDALARKSAIAEELQQAVEDALSSTAGRLKLVANLPYDIATPLIVDLLVGTLPFERLCFTVQAEVGGRFFAEAGSAEYGPVSIVAQLLTEGRRICRVPPQAFWPEPEVHSVMMRLDRRSALEAGPRDPARFAEFVRSFFLHRRKTMAHLARQREDADRCLAAFGGVGIAGERRPEDVTPGQWADLYREIC